MHPDAFKGYPDQTRNLNPTPGARVAMVLYGPRYGAFSGGSMDFWDSLSDSERVLCSRTADDVLRAAAAHNYTAKPLGG